MWRASKLMQKVGPLLNYKLKNIVNESIGADLNMQDEDIINFIQFSYVGEKKTYISTANLRYNSTSGLKSLPRMVSGNSI